MLEKLIVPFREFGAYGGLLYLLNRAGARVSSRIRVLCYDLMVQPIAQKPRVPARLARAFEIRPIRQGDPEIDRMPVRPGVPDLRFAQDATCLGLFRDGEMLGYMWYCDRVYREDEARLDYHVSPEGEAVFDFDFYLFPDRRIGLGFAALWDGVDRHLAGRGVKYTYSRVSRFNLDSRRAHDHLGWKRVGSMTILGAGFFEVGWGTVSPYLHVSVRESGRTRLALRPDVLERAGEAEAQPAPVPAQAGERAGE